MKKYKDVIKWTGENHEDVFKFMENHKFDLGLKDKYIYCEVTADKVFVFKNIDMKIEKGSYIIINQDNKIGLRTEEEMRKAI